MVRVHLVPPVMSQWSNGRTLIKVILLRIQSAQSNSILKEEIRVRIPAATPSFEIDVEIESPVR